jgi:hypothetical protein
MNLAATVVKHLTLGVFGLGCEDALQHLLNFVWPNIFEQVRKRCPHLAACLRCVSPIPASLLVYAITKHAITAITIHAITKLERHHLPPRWFAAYFLSALLPILQSPHVINAVMECIEAMRISLGPTRVLQHTLQVSISRSISPTRLRGSTYTCSTAACSHLPSNPAPSTWLPSWPALLSTRFTSTHLQPCTASPTAAIAIGRNDRPLRNIR